MPLEILFLKSCVKHQMAIESRIMKVIYSHFSSLLSNLRVGNLLTFNFFIIDAIFQLSLFSHLVFSQVCTLSFSLFTFGFFSLIVLFLILLLSFSLLFQPPSPPSSPHTAPRQRPASAPFDIQVVEYVRRSSLNGTNKIE